MERILALDPGEKRIGLAVSDELGWTAQGLPTLTRRGIKRDTVHLTQLVRDYQVSRVIVGVPYRHDGTLGVSGERMMAFIEQLSGLLTVPVVAWDERLTTKIAERLLIEGRVSRAKRKRSRDRLAAVLILQQYLDSTRDSSGAQEASVNSPQEPASKEHVR